MPINCQFNLSRSSAVYYTGEQVTGTLALTVAKKRPLQLEGISIALLGRSTTHWHEVDKSCTQIEHNDSTGRNEPVQLQFGGTTTHVEQRQKLAQSLLVPQGKTHQLGAFEFALPDSVPGSCRLAHGSIDYTLQLTLERRGKHAKCFQQRLIVRNRIELHEVRPAVCETRTLCLRLPRSVFVPGQRVAYQLQPAPGVAQVPGCKLVTRLCQCITYSSPQHLGKHKKVVRVLDDSCEWEGALHLPLTAPIMRQSQGELIEISYYLETLSDCSEPLRLPLSVGTVAPPVDAVQQPVSCPSLGFVNLGECSKLRCTHRIAHFSVILLSFFAALCENELLFSTINQLLPHSCSREMNASNFSFSKHSERLKLLRRHKKQSYVRLALRFFYKRLLPAN
ncbi:hypothetical protein KR222_011090 [Zaprionus bogoriensis]|nr:hypothetical protein KR222_011090 [Zaprionus bogoriensis]